jgi:hypothetical protein
MLLRTIPLLLLAPLSLATQDKDATRPEGDWVALFDGKSLDGWTQRNGAADYRIEDGAIVGRTTEGSPTGVRTGVPAGPRTSRRSSTPWVANYARAKARLAPPGGTPAARNL